MTLYSGPYLHSKYLNHLLETSRNLYNQAKPFPHLVIDEFLPANVLDRVLDEFPNAIACSWQPTGQPLERSIHKLAANSTPKSNVQMGQTTQTLLLELNSPTFISFLEQLTNTSGIMADPDLVNELSGHSSTQLSGVDRASLSSTDRLLSVVQPSMQSSSLVPQPVFVSQSVLPPHRIKPPLDRKINLLIYLNKDWKEEYGGHLELWNADMTHCEKRILPIFNRCVIFSTTDFSYHGHPEPLNCPDGESRKLLALSYYSVSSDRAAPPRSIQAANRPPQPRLPRLIPEGAGNFKNNGLVFRTNSTFEG